MKNLIHPKETRSDRFRCNSREGSATSFAGPLHSSTGILPVRYAAKSNRRMESPADDRCRRIKKFLLLPGEKGRGEGERPSVFINGAPHFYRRNQKVLLTRLVQMISTTQVPAKTADTKLWNTGGWRP